MARIRSIHPGIFTDEAFMQASPHARLLVIGLWCEAWDDGVFEWKPLTLKARIFPVDTVEVTALLDELSGLDFLRRFETGGKAYGVIRNFQRFQRPKKPNSSGVLPAGLAGFAGAGAGGTGTAPEGPEQGAGTEPARVEAGVSSEPVRNQFGTGGEKCSQMEDGGWRGREEESRVVTVEQGAASKRRDWTRADLDRLEDDLRRAAGLEGATSPGLLDLSPVLGLLEAGYELDSDVLPVIRAKGHGKVKSWNYFIEAVREARAARDGVAAKAAPRKPPGDRGKMEAGWREMMKRYQASPGSWPPDHPLPGTAGCPVPAAIQAEFGIAV